MGILLGIVCFAVALIILCGTLSCLIEQTHIIPMYHHKLQETIENILRYGFLIGVIVVILAVVAFFVLMGLAAILYLH